MIDYIKKFSLKGKKAIVCGGAGLLGREIVLALAQAGAEVVLADVDQKTGEKYSKLLKAKRLKVVYHYLDITDGEGLEDHLKNIIKEIKGVDIYVNTAYPRTPDWGSDIEDITVSSWRKNVDMHLNGYALSSKFVARQMKKKGGSIINMGSIYGVGGPDFTVYKNTKMGNSLIYAAIKGGIVNLSRYLSAHYGRYQVRVNTVCPGGVWDGQNPVFVKNYNDKVPLKRMANKDEIASAVLFLASDAASYITGTTFMVDGGWTAI